jgi:Lanthionine-containing peptide SapB precursor RamS
MALLDMQGMASTRGGGGDGGGHGGGGGSHLSVALCDSFASITLCL